MTRITKYPRTQHLEGSRLQPGDEDLAAVPFAALRGRHLVVEEKLDGSNVGVWFDDDDALVLQSRGHALRGGADERPFALLKAWARRHEDGLRAALGRRYVLYGEWLFAKHTVFYDLLPHYLHEFDVLDREASEFLDTPRRRALLADVRLPGVPVLHAGPVASLDALTALVRPSLYKSPGWSDALVAAATAAGVPVELAWKETDRADAAEGLYIKVEEQGRVVGRYKWVRAGFLQAVAASGSHWGERRIVENGLAPGVDLFA